MGVRERRYLQAGFVEFAEKRHRTYINVTASSAAPLFHLAEVRPLVPTWFRVVIVGQRVKPGSPREPTSDDVVVDTNDRRGIHTPTEFGSNGSIREEASPDRLTENHSEALLVLAIIAIFNGFLRVEVPVL